MSLPNLSGTARLYKDVDLRFNPNGMAIAKVPLVFNARKKDDAGNWVDGDSFFVTGLLFKERAEEAAEKLTRGAEVMVSGRPKTNSWEDREGNKRSSTELLIDSIGLTVREVLKKADRGGGFGQQDTYGGQGGRQGGRGGQSQPPAGDPWATSGQQGIPDDPPF
jgi:single-strand DNA-binding protein